MSTVGKVCLSLTLLLLLLAFLPIPGKFGGWTPKLLIFHNQWSEKLRDAKAATQQAMLSHSLAAQELHKATADLEGLTMGHDQFWTVPERGPNNPQGTPIIDKENGRLKLSNIGIRDGLKPRTAKDENGTDQQMDPVVFAFYAGAEGFNYAGEFIATEITDTSAVLQPVHAVLADDFAAWNINAEWRIRGIVSTAQRLQVDELYQHARRTFEMTKQADANIKRQDVLLKAAQTAYNVRRGELLGDANRPQVAGRPELTEGLLKVIEDYEEGRNQLQLNVDGLRRAIRNAIGEQTDFLKLLNQRLTTLPGSAAEYAQITAKPAEAE